MKKVVRFSIKSVAVIAIMFACFSMIQISLSGANVYAAEQDQFCVTDCVIDEDGRLLYCCDYQGAICEKQRTKGLKDDMCTPAPPPMPN